MRTLYSSNDNYLIYRLLHRRSSDTWNTLVLHIYMRHQCPHQQYNKLYQQSKWFSEKMDQTEVCEIYSFQYMISDSKLRKLFIWNFVCFSGAQKLAQIRENSNFFRSELQKMGFEVLGDNDSPVMPIMLYNPAKIPAFSRECLNQNVSNYFLKHTWFSFISPYENVIFLIKLKLFRLLWLPLHFLQLHFSWQELESAFQLLTLGKIWSKAWRCLKFFIDLLFSHSISSFWQLEQLCNCRWSAKLEIL